MPALTEWVDDALSQRANDLIFYNYTFETDSGNNLVERAIVDRFAQFLEMEKSKGKRASHIAMLDAFVKGDPGTALRGRAISFPKTGIVSVFTAGKVGRKFGFYDRLERELEKLQMALPPGIDATESDLVGDMLRRIIEQYFARLLRDRKLRILEPATSTPTASPPATGRRSISKPTRTADDMAFDLDQMLWCTTREAASILYQGKLGSPELALLLRRILGLPTVYIYSASGITVRSILDSLVYRMHFWENEERAEINPAGGLRKPTVFSGGYPDIYGSYWGQPRSDGWGRTITLCQNDAYDGTTGLPEAVVAFYELIWMRTRELGHVPATRLPGARAEQVRVSLFCKIRHGGELGMKIA